MKVSLVVMNAGKTAGHSIPITLSQFIIGRDPQCNLRPASPVISKRHCAILVKNGKVFVRDFDSTNGTFIGDTPVKGEVPLNHDNILKVGPLVFKVVIEKTAPVDKPTPPPKKTPGGKEEDVAAMLLSMQEEEEEICTAEPDEESEESVPGGSTVMEMQALPPMTSIADVPTPIKSATPPPPTEDPEARKPPEKPPEKKPEHNSARDAAKAILEKYVKRNRGG